MKIMKIPVIIIFFIICTYGCTEKNEDQKMKPQEDNILSPPFLRLPFLPDARVRHLNSKNQINYFDKFDGLWVSRKIDDKWVIVGEAKDRESYLLSKELLPNVPKKFMFDFEVFDNTSEFGFIYADNIIIVDSEAIFLLKFTHNEMQINKKSAIRIMESSFRNNKSGTFSVGTGYDPTGKNKIVTVMRINGRGIYITENETNKFGVYLPPMSSIILKNFRWFRGGK